MTELQEHSSHFFVREICRSKAERTYLNKSKEWSKNMTEDLSLPESLTGQLLIAMPQLEDDQFSKAIVYICAHNEEGALGLIINRPIKGAKMAELLEQLDITGDHLNEGVSIRSGGPVDRNRGFILHSTDYMTSNSMVVDDDIALTATTEILKDIAHGTGPEKFILALGYAGWGPLQLDQEILQNGWLHVNPTSNLLFSEDEMDTKWIAALSELGITPDLLSSEAGSA